MMFVGGLVDEVYSSLTGGNTPGLGDIYVDNNNNRYIFVQASGTVAQYDVVAIDSSNIAQAITKALADGGPDIGVARQGLSSGSYGWAQVRGAVSVNVLATCSSSIALFTSGTAGKLDDTTTSQTKIAGVTILANNTTTLTAAIVANIAVEPFAAL